MDCVEHGRIPRTRNRERATRADVQLAVHRHRQLIHHHDRGRHHELRQPLRHEPPRLGHINVSVGVGVGDGNDIGDQVLARGSVLPCSDRDVTHCRVRTKYRLDLAWLNPEPTDFHLLICTPEVLQVSIGTPPHQIPRAIHPLTRRTERIGHKPFRGQCWTVHIAPGQLRTRQIQLTRHTYRHRP